MPGRKLARQLRGQHGVCVGNECRDIRFRAGDNVRRARVQRYAGQSAT